MSIEVIYRVLKTNGELAGEYVDKKMADAHDQKLEGIYAIAELIAEHATDLDSDLVESIAEHLVNNKPAVINALKKIKDLPNQESPIENKQQNSNVETLERKQVVNG